MIIPRKRYLKIRKAYVFADLGRRFLRLEILGKNYWFFIRIHRPITKSEYIDIDFENAKSLNLLPQNYEEMSDAHKKEALEYLDGKKIVVSSNIPKYDIKKHSKIYKEEEKKKREEIKNKIEEERKKRLATRQQQMQKK